MSRNPHGLRKRSVVIAGHRTSLSLEQPFWDALKEIASGRGVSLARLLAEIDASRHGNMHCQMIPVCCENLGRAGGMVKRDRVGLVTD